ncbi:MAG: 50S ribosomal protein L25 [Planctomycetaceae bacterium]|nr:50S ribosomal protein L25 [Planctomycetaceae bacterium]
MSETTVLKANLRTKSGSHASAAVRKQGLLPAVIYGHKQEPVAVALDAHAFLEGVHGGNRIFELDFEGQGGTVMIKELQYDHLGKNVLHADLMRVNLSERVTVAVPIELRGTAEGTQQGGIVEMVLSSIEIECTVRDIPESLPVVIKDLGLNQSMHAAQIVLPAEFKLVTAPEAVVVVCREPVAIKVEEVTAEGAEAAEAGAAAPTEPEVITERKKEESEEKK